MMQSYAAIISNGQALDSKRIAMYFMLIETETDLSKELLHIPFSVKATRLKISLEV